MYYHLLNCWVQNPQPDYNEGIDILSKLDGTAREIQFLRAGNDEMRLNILRNKLLRLYRIAVQNGKINTQPLVKPIEPKELLIKAKQLPELIENQQLFHNKELTNKLLAYQWADLSDREKTYFDSQESFAEKKALYAQAIELRKQMSALHLKLKAATTDEDRKTIADELLQLQNQDISYWKLIDTFGENAINDIRGGGTDAMHCVSTKAEPDIQTLTKRLTNLRTYITKTKKAMEASAEKDKEGFAAKLLAYHQEAEEIESKLNG